MTHAQHLLAAAQRPPATAPASCASEDGLSERERQVLRLLATELSGPEIAGELFVSVNTLRTHTKHIFSLDPDCSDSRADPTGRLRGRSCGPFVI
ncbi:MAG: response regulator transcription factor [Solirubrobacteraceae bacterium]